MAHDSQAPDRTTTTPWGLVVAAAAVGLTAAVLYMASRRRGQTLVDVDSIIDACDRAAAKLETVILGDQAKAS